MDGLGDSPASGTGVAARGLAVIGYRAVLGLTAITDVLPAGVRFGHWQRVLSALAIRNGLASIPRSPLELVEREATPTPQPEQDLRCLVVAGSLDGGGVETVVATLARGLPAHGIATEVVCTTEGRTSSELRLAGIRVTRASASELSELVDHRNPDVVQLHRPERQFAAALLSSGAPVVPVFHAMESYLNTPTWAALTALAARSPVCVAVSEGVKTFFEHRLRVQGIQVVVNGVPDLPTGSAWERGAARRAVGRAVGAEIAEDDLLVVALQRFSDQKNAAGLVDAFLAAVTAEPRLRLVLAGSPDNWLEVRRADLLRRASPLGGRVHLLADSNPWVVLRAGDVYALDSFAEGGPLSAVEAVMCGLPVVLSNVGFARDLVASAGVQGLVVNRANADYSQLAIAAQRRRRHQSNRDEFGDALAAAAQYPRSAGGTVPPSFTEAAMVLGHATALRAAARSPR
jgi:glycosyltransferase involved in cell wall biosynthesis